MDQETKERELRVVKTASCPSLSGKSKLGYEVACGPAADVHVRIAKNSGTGMYSRVWVAWDQLQRVLDKNAGKPITAHTLSPLFKGLSVNTAGFLLAALRHEGLVVPMEEQPRCHTGMDTRAFLAEVQALAGAAGGSPKKKPRSTATAKTAAANPRSAKKR